MRCPRWPANSRIVCPMPITVHTDDREKPQILYLGVDAGYFALLQYILHQAGFAATAASPEDLQRQMARLKPNLVLIDMALGWPLQDSAIEPLTRQAVAKIVLVGSRRAPIQESALQRLRSEEHRVGKEWVG